MLIAISVLFVFIALIGWALLYAMHAASCFDAAIADIEREKKWLCEDCGNASDNVDDDCMCLNCGECMTLNMNSPAAINAYIAANMKQDKNALSI